MHKNELKLYSTSYIDRLRRSNAKYNDYCCRVCLNVRNNPFSVSYVKDIDFDVKNENVRGSYFLCSMMSNMVIFDLQ